MTTPAAKTAGQGGADGATVHRLFGKRDAMALFLRASGLDESEETLPLAEALYREAVTLAPRMVQGWVNLGICQFRRGELSAALDSWSRALVLQPGMPEACHNIGHAYAAQEQHELAAVYFAEAVSSSPGFGEARVNLALELQALGQTESALRHWLEYLRREPRGEWSALARKHAALLSRGV